MLNYPVYNAFLPYITNLCTFGLNHQLHLFFILEVFRLNLDHELSRDFLQSRRNGWRDVTLKYATTYSSKIPSN